MAQAIKNGSELGSLKLVTVPRTAEILSISERSAWRLVSTGELATVKLGRSTRVKVESIDKLIERGGAA